jgi:hypothetical protein
MSNVEEILRESIEDKCGLGGLMRFNALYTGGFETADGRPDLAGISAAVNGAFPEEQAAAIVAAVMKKLESGRQPSKSHAAAKAGAPGNEGQEAPHAFAKYFDVDPNHVRDIVNEARRLRAAMGKSMPSQWAPHSDKVVVNKAPETDAPAEAALAEKVTEIKTAGKERAKTPEAVKPLPQKAPVPPVRQAEIRPRPARVIAEPLSAIDEEIRQFAYGRTACTSIDIIDFIRYLKDKGYSLQEYIVLEKIYVTIEERKKEARFAIEKEIEGLIDARQAPEESDIQGLLRRLSEAGLVFEKEDVRRMIRGAVLRRA